MRAGSPARIGPLDTLGPPLAGSLPLKRAAGG